MLSFVRQDRIAFWPRANFIWLLKLGCLFTLPKALWISGVSVFFIFLVWLVRNRHCSQLVWALKLFLSILLGDIFPSLCHTHELIKALVNKQERLLVNLWSSFFCGHLLFGVTVYNLWLSQTLSPLLTGDPEPRLNSLHQVWEVFSRQYAGVTIFPCGSDGKESSCNAGDPGSIPGSERSPEGNGNPLQFSCLENPVDRGAWWATVHGVARSGTRLSD